MTHSLNLIEASFTNVKQSSIYPTSSLKERQHLPKCCQVVPGDTDYELVCRWVDVAVVADGHNLCSTVIMT